MTMLQPKIIDQATVSPEPEGNVLAFPKSVGLWWPASWRYDHLCAVCHRFGQAFVGIWQNYQLVKLIGYGRTITLNNKDYFVCDGCWRSHLTDRLVALIIAHGQTTLKPINIRRQAWEQWQSVISWPLGLSKLIVQAILDGFITQSNTSQVTPPHRCQFFTVLADLHIWIVTDEIANWLRLYQEADDLTKELWLVTISTATIDSLNHS